MTKQTSGHPGPYIRHSVFPADLSVTAAAKALGVGRPALSNLLNGNASLSPEMATRIEKAFGASSEDLLKMQAEYDRAIAREREPAIAVRSYAPSFLQIKAMQIEAWSERLEVRAELAALVRRLVTSTGKDLSKVDFPAFENSQRKGWDGTVVSGSATPWTPMGNSGWEFGVNRDPAKKAEEDYAARTKSVDADTRLDTTFVFVTPRNWPEKEQWAARKRATGQWKDVRAYDASDLEQWIEVSIPAQAWMSERLPGGASDVESLDASWKRWAGATNPEFSKKLFSSAAGVHAAKLVQWLERAPERPFTVVADSVEEALAGLACLSENAALRQMNAAERVVVAKSANAISKLSGAAADLIVVLASADAQTESAGIQRQHHTIIVLPRNAIDADADVTLDLVDHETFRAGLAEMGFDGDGAERLARESGHSLTVLRRRLSEIPAIRTPPWAAQQGVADRLIPLALVGAWDSSSEADQAVLAHLAAGTHDEIERSVAELLAGDQSPVWSVGKFRGVVSKVDAFYAVRAYITKAHLERFFQVAQIVLSEADPALDLPEEQRWAANLYGKSRRHSSALRQGFCETLVLLSVHGTNLFKTRLGLDVPGKVDALIRSLLTPLDASTWQSQQRDLPRYAEAAPEVFLDILEQDLQSAEPKVHALMQPVGSGGFSSPDRTGLLWALEVLAWNPDWLSRVVVILGKLAEIKINDNWANRPDNSLTSIFRSWMPQTAAGIDQRIEALLLLIRKSPDIGWRICIDQFDPHSSVGHYSYRPHWRKDAAGAGEVVTNIERHGMASRALQLAIGWPNHNAQTLGDLVDRLSGIAAEDHEAIWSAIEAWVSSQPSDEQKASLRERIRRSTMTRRGRARGLERKLRMRAKGVYDLLEPTDVVFRHHWLFAQQWVEESADELAKEDVDFEKRDERIGKLRQSALREVWSALGYQGIVRLCLLSEAPGIIGWHIAAGVFDKAALEQFVSKVLDDDTTSSRQAMDRCLVGMLMRIDPETRRGIVLRVVDEHLADSSSPLRVRRLLLNTLFGDETWRFVDRLPADEQRAYWKEATPSRLFGGNAQEANRVVEELLKVDRPRAAFNIVAMEFATVESSRLVRLLVEAATNSAEPEGHYQLQSHNISDAFEELSKRADVLPDELARLEFLYIDALDHTKHGIRNLENQICQSPELFVQVLAFAYRRRDGGEDPPELRASNQDSAAVLAAKAYRLLSHARRTPGTNDLGELDAAKLREWIRRVRELARDYGREAVADSVMGQMLGRSKEGADGIWPNEGIREVLEDLGTSELANGMSIGRYNARGVVARGVGGAQERALAQSYRTWSRQLAHKHPFTSRLLNEMARMYDHDAERHDTDSEVRRRLHD